MTVDYFEVSVTVEIAFGYGAFDTPVWTDVSEYVREFTTDRGRQDEFGSYSPGTARVVLSNAGRRFDPSHAAGDYYGNLVPMVPLRISAIYAPAVLDEDGGVLLDEEGDIIGVGPGDSVEYPLFYGFVQGWPQQYVDNIDSTVAVDCVDAFRLLEQAALAESAYKKEVDADSPIAYWPFQGSMTDVVADTRLAAIYGTTFQQGSLSWIPGSCLIADDSFSYMHTTTPLAAAPRSIEFVLEADSITGSGGPPDYNLTVQSSDTDWIWFTNTSSTFLVSWSNTTLNRESGSPFAYFRPVAGQTYHVVVNIDHDERVRFYVDGELIGGSGAGSVGTNVRSFDQPRVALSQGSGISHLAVYDAPLSSTRIAAHHNAGRHAWGGDFVEFPGARVSRVLNEIGWPSGTRDIADGGIELGEYLPSQRSALDYIREIETTEQGLFFVGPDGDIVFRDRGWQFDQTSVADFGDSGSDLPFVDVVPDGNTVDVVRNQVKVIYNGSDSNVVVEDATSIAAYGYGSDSLSTPAIQTIGPARGLASFKVRVGKDPRTRVSSLLVMPRSDPTNLFPAVLGVDLGEVVTVSFTPLGVGSASTFTTSIQGVRHSVGRGRWDVEFYLAPAVSESGPYWKIGDATLGRIGAAYGNLLSY